MAPSSGPLTQPNSELVSLRHRLVDVLKASRGFANGPDQFARMLLLLAADLAMVVVIPERLAGQGDRESHGEHRE